MVDGRIIHVLAADGISGGAMSRSEDRDERWRSNGTETHNGLAAVNARSSRRPWPNHPNRRPCIARERSLCCVGSWFPGHTQRRFAVVAAKSREKTGLCLPATQWVPRSLGGSTAERFSSPRRRSRISLFGAACHSEGSVVPEMTEWRCRAFSPIAPHRVCVCACSAFSSQHHHRHRCARSAEHATHDTRRVFAQPPSHRLRRVEAWSKLRAGRSSEAMARRCLGGRR